MTKLQKALWWASGAYSKLLIDSPSSWNKYYIIGLSNFLNSIFGGLSLSYACSYLSDNLIVPIILGSLWAMLIFNIDRYISSSFRHPSKKYLILQSIPRIVVSIILSLTASISFQLQLFHTEIQNIISAQKIIPNNGLIQSLDALHYLKGSSNSAAMAIYFIHILFIIIGAFPLIAVLFINGREYDAAIEAHTELQLYESHLRAKKIISQMDEVVAEQKPQDKRHEKNQIEGLDFYIDYSILSLTEISRFFENINSLYQIVYLINDSDQLSNTRTGSLDRNVFKTLPEANLIFNSIETGNSITFKVTTGWKPKVEILQGDFVISIPKGSVALLVTGFLIAKIFEYGVSGYKQILEVQKLKTENKLLQEQLIDLGKKIEQSPEIVKANFQEELVKIYKSSLENNNFKQIIVTQDSLVIQKMMKGQLTFETK